MTLGTSTHTGREPLTGWHRAGDRRRQRRPGLDRHPYSWGGGNANGPTAGICCSPSGHDDRHIIGFDCSGLVLYAYAQIGIHLPHLAHDISYHSGGQAIPRDLLR